MHRTLPRRYIELYMYSIRWRCARQRTCALPTTTTGIGTTNCRSEWPVCVQVSDNNLMSNNLQLIFGVNHLQWIVLKFKLPT